MRRLSGYNNPYINSSYITCAIHSIISVAVDIGIVISRHTFDNVVDSQYYINGSLLLVSLLLLGTFHGCS